MAIDWGNIASGTIAGGLSGAGTGATIGSLWPGPGNAIGAAIGGGVGAFGGGLASYFGSGKKGGIERSSAPNKQEQSILEYLLSQGKNQFEDPTQGFDEIEKYLRSNFNEKTIPSLAERFTSMSNGALSSPSFSAQLGQAGASFDQSLGALRADYGMQNRNQALDMLRLGIAPSSQTHYQNSEPGFGYNLLTQLLPLIAQAGPQLYKNYIKSKNPTSAITPKATS